jgi:hypothetical protein
MPSNSALRVEALALNVPQRKYHEARPRNFSPIQ